LVREAAAFTFPFRITFAEDTGYHWEGNNGAFTQDVPVKVITPDGLTFLGVYDGHGGHQYSQEAGKVTKRLVKTLLDRMWREIYNQDSAYCLSHQLEEHKADKIRELGIQINKETDSAIGYHHSGTTVNLGVIDPLTRTIYDFNLGDSSMLLFEPKSEKNTAKLEMNVPSPVSCFASKLIMSGFLKPLELSCVSGLAEHKESKFENWNQEETDDFTVFSSLDHSADQEREKERATKLRIPIYQDTRGTYRLDGQIMTTGGFGDKYTRGVRRADESDVYRRKIKPGTTAVITTDGLFEGMKTRLAQGKPLFLGYDPLRISSMAKYIAENRKHPKLAYGLMLNQLDDITEVSGDYWESSMTGEKRPWINCWDNHCQWTVEFD
jgi:serine/threonine protein phosphatase PrpC